MRNELNEIEKIEQYLEGKMSSSERTSFELQLQADENLRNHVQLQEQLTQRIRINAFRNEIASFHLAYTDTAATRAGKFRFYFNALLLLGVVAVVAVCVYYFLPDSKNAVTTPLAHVPQTGESTEKNNLVPGTAVVAEKNPNEPATAVQPDRQSKKIIRSTAVIPGETKETVAEETLPLPLPPAENAPCNKFYLSTHSQTIDATTGGDVVTADSRSVLHFPGNIMTDQYGNPVKGQVEIRYREYRNAAQMAFSGIPMNYEENGKKYRFNSGGMFDVRAYQEGKELRIKPGAAFRVDYNMTGNRDSSYFFVLDEKTRTWKKLNHADRGAHGQKESVGRLYENPKGNGQIFIRVHDAATGKIISDRSQAAFVNPAADLYNTNIILDSGYNVASIVRGTYTMQISADGYRKMKVNDIKVFEDRITYLDVKLAPVKDYGDMKKQVEAEENKPHSIWGRLFSKKPKKFGVGNMAYTRNSTHRAIALPEGDRETGRPNAGKNTAETPSSPNLLLDLRCESFGIYTCNELYLIKSPVNIEASYYTTSGKEITNGYVVSLIDLSYNGAFSFEPGTFTCSRKGQNVLLLFTSDQKLYACSREDFRKMNITGSGRYAFTMTDITGQVKNSEDLRRYLGL